MGTYLMPSSVSLSPDHEPACSSCIPRASSQQPIVPFLTPRIVSCPPPVSHENPPVVTQDFSNLRKALELGWVSSNVAPPTLPGAPMDLELAEVEAKGEEASRECSS